MNSMKCYTVRDLADAFSGYAFSAEELIDTGIPVLKIGNVQRQLVTKDVDSYYAGEISEKLKKYILQQNDFLIAMTGAGSVGRVGKMHNNDNVYLVNQRVAIVRPKNVDAGFLYYWFTMPFVEKYLYQLGIGAGQPNISGNDILKTKIQIPCRSAQERIANVLSKYDELIEVNNKRIKLLEQTAEDYFKITYGNEIKLKRTELVKLEAYIEIVRGLSYSSEEIDCDDGINLVNLKNIQAFGGFRRDGNKSYNGKYKEQQIVQQGDLVMGVTDMTQDRRTVGSVALIPYLEGTSVISADLIKINSSINNNFLYCLFRFGNVSKYISQFANGANVLHLRPEAVKKIKVMMPSNEYIDKFSAFVEPIFDEIEKLYIQNDNLIKQRDLLLPRLMSGKLEVK